MDTHEVNGWWYKTFRYFKIWVNSSLQIRFLAEGKLSGGVSSRRNKDLRSLGESQDCRGCHIGLAITWKWLYSNKWVLCRYKMNTSSFPCRPSWQRLCHTSVGLLLWATVWQSWRFLHVAQENEQRRFSSRFTWMTPRPLNWALIWLQRMWRRRQITRMWPCLNITQDELDNDWQWSCCKCRQFWHLLGFFFFT